MCFLRISLFIPGRSHGHEEVGPRGTGALHAVLWTSGRLPKCLEPQEPLTPGTERQELLSAAILLHAELWSCFGLIIPCYVPVPPREVEYSLCAIVYRKLITFFLIKQDKLWTFVIIGQKMECLGLKVIYLGVTLSRAGLVMADTELDLESLRRRISEHISESF